MNADEGRRTKSEIHRLTTKAMRQPEGTSLRILLVMLGIGIAASDLISDSLLNLPPEFGLMQRLILVIGVALAASGFLVSAHTYLKWIPSFILTSTLPIITVVVMVAFLEGFFHLVSWDFANQEKAFMSWPTYFRWPTDPIGDIYFKRPGPETYVGKPLTTFLMKSDILNDSYQDEAQITATYDANGFRNPIDLIDWDIVVIGDSFVELGYLGYEDLYTTLIGKILSLRVKNLGVSYTGPLTYIYYLRNYGKALSTRHAIMVFFEGNDLEDLSVESNSLERYKARGERPYRNFNKQSSLIRAIRGWVFGSTDSHSELFPIASRSRSSKLSPDAYFLGSKTIPITLGYSPPRTDQLTVKQKFSLNAALAQWAITANSMNIKPWLLYMPCKRRVLDGHLSFMPHADERLITWKPTDLPDLLRSLSDSYKIEFIDPTPALAAEANQGVLTYNSIADTHLNHHGSQIVASVVSGSLRSYFLQANN